MLILKEIKSLDTQCTPRYNVHVVTTSMPTLSKLRPGRRKITASFVLAPWLYEWMKQQYPNVGDVSYVISSCLKLIKDGELKIPERPKME